MARKSSLGVFRNGEDEVVFEGVTVPGRLLVQALGLGGDPDMFAEFEINNGKAECSRIEWRRSRDELWPSAFGWQRHRCDDARSRYR
jgi:hypothetical protein